LRRNFRHPTSRNFHENLYLRRWRELTPQRAIGCIVYPATEIEAPSVICHLYGDRFPIGEPSGETSSDVQQLSTLFAEAGMQVEAKSPVFA
jgi:2-dehydropantoate 2-reductase